jgi:excisionase family DNA binding protein
MQIDVREAARLLGVSENTIYRWIKQGHGAAGILRLLGRIRES